MEHKYCLLTGIDLLPDGSSNGFKKMCLNCKCCEELIDEFVCYNEKVLETGKKKILESVPEGFEIETLELKPMKLKNPTKKCPNHEFDTERVFNYISKFFGVGPETVENENRSE